MAGEASGQLVAGEKLDQPSILAEGALEFFGVGETVLSSATERARMWLGGPATAAQQAHTARTLAGIARALDDSLAQANTALERGEAADLRGAENLLRGAGDLATATRQTVDEKTRRALAHLGDPVGDLASQEPLLARDPATSLAAIEIGQALRDAYGGPEREAQVQRVAQARNVSPELANTLVDQHTALAAARDLQKVLFNAPIDPRRAQALTNLGFLETNTWPRNVRVLDGYSVLFDVIAQIPPARALAWCLERVRGRSGP